MKTYKENIIVTIKNQKEWSKKLKSVVKKGTYFKYAIALNQIVNWGKCRNDLEEWCDMAL
jgi:hypothetical protein